MWCVGGMRLWLSGDGSVCAACRGVVVYVCVVSGEGSV